MVIAVELAEELKHDGISRAELARRHGMSRARVTQWLSLMELPRIEIERVLAMGDYWERRLVTERGIRKHILMLCKNGQIIRS
jgi:DNA-binding Xre family transcriptional regulator